VPVLRFDCVVPAPLHDVWAFHDDVTTALPALSPPASRVRVESADLPVRAGSRVVVRARGPLGLPIRMAARILEHAPPRDGPGGSPGGASAYFKDEQTSGPFAAWLHEHIFTALSPDQTRVTDRVTYTLPLGPLGALADRLFVRRQIAEMFRHRHEVLRQRFASRPRAAVHSPA